MSYHTYDDSVWFKLYLDKLENDFKPSNELKLESNIKHACVAAIIRLNPNYPSNEDIAPFDILFIRRAIKKGDPWSGQIAFPGGRHEGTETLQQTAERETMEEIGLDITSKTGNYKCIGYCYKMDITRGKYTLRVISFIFLQCIIQTPKLNIYKKEVDSVAWINLSQLTNIPFTAKDKHKYTSMVEKLTGESGVISLKEDFSSRHSHAWSNMMVNPKLNEKIKFINDKMDCYHCNLFLQFQHRLIPTNLTKYPAIILRTGMKHNDYWLLWGLTYRMIGFILTAMKINHYLRYKRISKASWLLGTQIMYLAREYFGLKLQWRSAGIEPYFVKTLKSKL